jgi:four helix bundle protein
MKSQSPNLKPYDIKERTLEFSVRILQVAAALPESPEAGILKRQLVAAGTSIGANVEEADGAVSRADKRKSFVIARKEARETRYWLTLVDRVWGKTVDVTADVKEATELLYILSSIVDKLA